MKKYWAPGIWKLSGIQQHSWLRHKSLSGELDTVTCSGVIEHIPNAKEAMLEFHGVLRTDGRLLLIAPIGWVCVLGREVSLNYHTLCEQKRVWSRLALFDNSGWPNMIILLPPLRPANGNILCYIPYGRENQNHWCLQTCSTKDVKLLAEHESSSCWGHSRLWTDPTTLVPPLKLIWIRSCING